MFFGVYSLCLGILGLMDQIPAQNRAMRSLPIGMNIFILTVELLTTDTLFALFDVIINSLYICMFCPPAVQLRLK